MRKILSVVLAVLMVSMIIPTMSFAAYADITGLVAGETFTVTPTSDVTVSVNTQVFEIVGGTVATDGKTASIEATANTAVEIKVKTSIPKEFTSQVKVGDEFVNVSVADRILGDVTGEGQVTITDAAIIAAYVGDASSVTAFKVPAADVDGNGSATITDAALIASYVGDASSVSIEGLGTAYLGGDADVTVEDPWTAEPEVKKLATPTGVYAYHQNGTVYFTFDSVESATSYDVKVGDGEATTVTATSGSVAATYADGLTISVVAKADGFDASDAATANVVDATVSGELATWLANNGLSDVAITVYEITE